MPCIPFLRCLLLCTRSEDPNSDSDSQALPPPQVFSENDKKKLHEFQEKHGLNGSKSYSSLPKGYYSRAGSRMGSRMGSVVGTGLTSEWGSRRESVAVVKVREGGK
jgi:hypothetical protein